MRNLRHIGYLAVFALSMGCGGGPTAAVARDAPETPRPPPEATVQVLRAEMGAECWINDPPEMCGAEMEIAVGGPDCMREVEGVIVFVFDDGTRELFTARLGLEPVWPGSYTLKFRVTSHAVQTRTSVETFVDGEPRRCQ